ncbi:cytochrome c-type biogenesis protein CcmH [bacterium]|nr:cytochrome c-type biogenesis protein CcmH [bacterium]
MALLIWICLAGASVADDGNMVSDFMCPCPDLCGKALEVCECSDAAIYIKEIADFQAGGLSRTQIREKFVEKYGPTVLASPPARGFGLLAYVLPPLAVLAGAAIVVALARGWRRSQIAEVARPKPLGADLKKAEEWLNKWNSSK